MATYKKKSRGPTPKAADRTWHKNYRVKVARPKKRVAEKKDNIIYGVNAVYEYLKSATPAQKLILASGLKPDQKLQDIIKCANENSTPIYELPKPQIDTLTGSSTHQGVVLYSQEYQYFDLQDLIASRKTIVVLDHITDPHNLGATIRSAAAFGANIVIPNARSVKVNATVWKTSAGNAMKTKIAQVPNLNTALDKIQKAGYFTVGLDGDADYTIEDSLVKDNELVAFVAGNEGAGLAALTKKTCDALAKIPTSVESLNVAQAVSIALYSFSYSH